MPESFDSYVIRSILLNNEFNIKNIKKINEIRTMVFERNFYNTITDLIQKRKIETIKNLADYPIRTSEYLTVMEVIDQDEKKYIVTVYDSDDLAQDPQVIHIFS